VDQTGRDEPDPASADGDNRADPRPGVNPGDHPGGRSGTPGADPGDHHASPSGTPGADPGSNGDADFGPAGPDRAQRIRRRLIIAFDAVLLIIVLVLLYQRALPQASAALGFGSSNEPAPLFTLATLDGDSISLSDLRGQVVLVNFWASWCPPCRVEMPGFERIYRERAQDGFVILGIATDVSAQPRIRAFLNEHDITYPTLLATPRVIRDYGGVNALPESYLIDRQGRIRHKVIGFFAEPALRAAVNRMLEET
jgi:cytochrome c biogenesis protein CcmG, thiol:disulfide interchange protein DsbE